MREEKNKCIAWQRSPISRKIYSALLDQEINKTVVFECFTLIQIRGLLCAEYAQKKQTNVEEHKYASVKHVVKAFLLCAEWAQKIQTNVKEHEYASGKHVVKAFVPSNWKFYNSKGILITDPMEVPKKLKMTF